MHIERLTILRDWLRAGAVHERLTFDLTIGYAVKKLVNFDPESPTPCTAVCCIAGAAVDMFNDAPQLIAEHKKERRPTNVGIYALVLAWTGRNGIFSHARTLLELNEYDAKRLFNPGDYGRERNNYNYNDPQLTADVIDHLITNKDVEFGFQYWNIENKFAWDYFKQMRATPTPA